MVLCYGTVAGGIVHYFCLNINYSTFHTLYTPASFPKCALIYAKIIVDWLAFNHLNKEYCTRGLSLATLLHKLQYVAFGQKCLEPITLVKSKI